MSSTPTRITHLLGGAPWTGTSARTSPVFNPATGEQTGELDLASADLVDEVVTTARAAWESCWQRASLAQRTQVLFAFRELLNERKGEHRRDHHRRARQGALRRRSARSPVASRSSSSRAASRTCSRAASPRTSRPRSTSTRSASRWASSRIISPFNFPAMVPMWFFPIAIACGNTVVIKPSEKDPSAVNAVAALWKEAGLPDGVLQRRARRQGGRRRAARPTPTSRPSPSSARPRSPGTSTRPAPRTASACRRSAARRTTCSSCPTPTSTSPPTRRSTPASARPVSAAWRSRRSSRSSRSPTSWSARSPTGWASCVTGDGTRGCDMGPLVTAAAPRQGRRPTSTPAPRRARRSSSTGASVDVDADGEGFWLGPTLFDNVTTDMSIYTDEIFGPVLSVVRVAVLRRGARR